jgi:lipoprotein NlpD
MKHTFFKLFLPAVLAALVLASCSTNVPVPTAERRPVTHDNATIVGGEVRSTRPATSGTAASARSATTHTMRQGETLYSVARANNLDPDEVAMWNNIVDPTQIAAGQTIRLTPPPGTDTVTTAPLAGYAPVEERTPGVVGTELPGAYAPPAQKPFEKTSPKATKTPYSEQRLAAIKSEQAAATALPEALVPDGQPSVTVVEPPTADNQTATVSAKPLTSTPAKATPPAWIWPTQGKVVSRFSESAQLKGIDIVGAIGQPVVASAAGRIVYVGSGLRGYGKLVIVKHNDTFLSVYAHNREIYVKQGENVKQGQKLAEMGNTDADQVKLHFEVRQDGKPVDPMKFLPGK